MRISSPPPSRLYRLLQGAFACGLTWLAGCSGACEDAPRAVSDVAPSSATGTEPPAPTGAPSAPLPLIATPRPVVARPPTASQRLAHAARLGAHGADVENPCVVAEAGPCPRTALEPFFRALDDTQSPALRRRATVSVLGNSLIASDHIVDIFRERLVERFGDGGRGFVLVDRMAPYGPRTRTGIANSAQWNAHNFSMGDPGNHPFGVSGVVHVSNTRSARTLWRLQGERRARIYLHDHDKSPTVQVTVDDREPVLFAPTGQGQLAAVDLALPAGAGRLVLEANGPGAAVYGALLEGEGPGVSVNTYGVPAAGASHFLAVDGPIFAEQLQAQDPALVVVMLGGNETKRLHWRKRNRDEVEQSFTALLAQLQKTVPRAACLAVSPIDAVHGGQKKSWQPRAQLGWVIDMQRRVATAAGCAYFDLYRAMGGAGSLKRFHDAGFLHDDMVHPKSGGLDMLGELLADALLRAYEATPRIEPALVNVGTAAVEPPPNNLSDG